MEPAKSWPALIIINFIGIGVPLGIHRYRKGKALVSEAQLETTVVPTREQQWIDVFGFASLMLSVLMAALSFIVMITAHEG